MYLEKKSGEERNSGRETEKDTEAIYGKEGTVDVATETKNGDETGTEALRTDLLGTKKQLTGLQETKRKVNGEEDQNKGREGESDQGMTQKDLLVLGTSLTITGIECWRCGGQSPKL